MRTLSDSIRLRNHVLNLFEQAVWEEDVQVRSELLTLVVVGGGPTGGYRDRDPIFAHTLGFVEFTFNRPVPFFVANAE